jgi:integrase
MDKTETLEPCFLLMLRIYFQPFSWLQPERGTVMSVFLRGNCKRARRHSGECKHFHFSFRIRGKRYRGAIPEAGTKWQAEQAEQRIRQAVFEGQFGNAKVGTAKLSDFIDHVYLPWAKSNKRSWKDDWYKLPTLKAFFQNTSLRDVTPFSIERFKQVRLTTPTKHNHPRSFATVSLEMALLSRIFSLAMDFNEVETNLCLKVAKLKLDNQRYRYLLPEEEPKLRSVLTGQRSHLAELVPVAIGTGLRKNEQLALQVKHIDFARNLILVTGTKTRRNREVSMNSEVRAIMLRLCRSKSHDDYVFVSQKTGGRLTDVKRSFRRACAMADINGLVWHDLRATFGTRLGEAGFDAFAIAALMGQSNVRTTQRYVRATERNKREAVEAAMLGTTGHNLATRVNANTQKRAVA